MMHLEEIKERKCGYFEPKDVALAAGILNSVSKSSFIFMLHFMNGIFNTLEAANQILQKRDGGQPMPVIEAVFETWSIFDSKIHSIVSWKKHNKH